ncbi:ZapG family protein [Paraglaciecola sp. 2405UD69-4]|uniref:ZapG family protein n=1 Tax=Paraglaciecola sp. 2405UD69-4 TaxID=3391836 RepID=UPI0039C8CF7D
MDWLVGILLLIVGAVIGFFVAKYFNDKEVSNNSEGEKELTIKEIMAQQASHHLHQVKRISAELNAQSEALNKQIDEYEQLIIDHSTGADDSSINYFGEHATTYLRNSNSTEKNNIPNADVQPLDFASQSSGLFSGNEEVVEKESK